MSQMVLPQAPPQGPQADNGSKSVSGNREKDGDSPFDSVSRAEQQRIDRKQAEKRDQARAEDATHADQTGQGRSQSTAGDDPEEPRTHTQAGNSETHGQEGAPKKSTAETEEAVPAEDSVSPSLAEQEALEKIVPLTFAELQALVMPAGGNTAAAAGGNPATGNGTLPDVQAFAGMIAGLPGNTAGKQALSTVQGTGSNGASGLALTDALLSGVAADASRPQETPSLQGAVRFQGAVELANQQLANPNTAKLPAEVANLRGYTTSIDVPVNHAEWGDKLVGKLTWLTARNMSVAEIHLTPPDMGPMEVRVQVQQEQAHITVHSANPAVRDQLELHSHRLRDMLSEQGLSLDQFDVSDSSQQQAGEDNAGEGSRDGGAALADGGPDEQDLPPESLDLTWKGEVDIFA
ncbi:flagellar hook-length control protein FliK [Marinobacter algicola]|uniref:flagellar hook-length control protein FliK n=1 Tax=Marinobacter algicola TaxID=236100 RepID=UPI003BAB1443